MHRRAKLGQASVEVLVRAREARRREIADVNDERERRRPVQIGEHVLGRRLFPGRVAEVADHRERHA
jgi:hypothetical protein